MSGRFDKALETGKVRLFDHYLMESVIADECIEMPFEWDENDTYMSMVVDFYLSQTLTENNYIIWKLRAKGYTLEQIGGVFGIKRNSVCERIKRIEKTIKNLACDLGKQRTLDAKIRDIVKELEK